MYRELKLRSSIVSGRQLKVLPQEQVYNTVGGIWNLSSDQGNLGTFILSNIRLIWFADINESFNISLPYMQIGNVIFHFIEKIFMMKIFVINFFSDYSS